MKNLLNNLEYLLRRTDKVKEKKVFLEESLKEWKKRIEWIEKGAATLELSKLYFSKALELFHNKSRGELEKVVNQALEYIFFDKQYEFKIEMSDERGQKSMDFVILDLSEGGLELDVRSGVGAGIRTIISFVIHFYYLLRSDSLLCLFIDEGYSQISTDYIERFFTFIKTLAKKKDFILVLISHDDRIIQYADKYYFVADGRVTS